MTASERTVTELLRAWSGGDQAALDVSTDTVKRDWRIANLWLLKFLEGDPAR